MNANEKRSIQLAIAEEAVCKELTNILEQNGYSVRVKVATDQSPTSAAGQQQADLFLCDHPIAQQQAKLDAILDRAGTVCHELNQPLQTVTGYCDLIMLDMDAADANYARFEKIRSEAERMGRIARQLMNLIRNRTLSNPPPTIGLDT